MTDDVPLSTVTIRIEDVSPEDLARIFHLFKGFTRYTFITEPNRKNGFSFTTEPDKET